MEHKEDRREERREERTREEGIKRKGVSLRYPCFPSLKFGTKRPRVHLFLLGLGGILQEFIPVKHLFVFSLESLMRPPACILLLNTCLLWISRRNFVSRFSSSAIRREGQRQLTSTLLWPLNSPSARR